MTDPQPGRATSPFHPNLDQQRKRAKDLLRALKAGDGDALARFALYHPDGRPALPASVTLSEAQLVIARELGLPSWSRLRAHVAALDSARSEIVGGAPPDAAQRTLHIRCGHDIQRSLAAAGFVGDFLAYSDPFCQGPVTASPDWLEQRIDFIAGSYGADKAPLFGGDFAPRDRASIRQERLEAEAALRGAAETYDRVVLWFEHDSYDQLILARLLAHFATGPRPGLLELVQVNAFPGGESFIGLGQLPPAALRHLWRTRRPVEPAALALGAAAWEALRRPEPLALHALAAGGTPALPDMAPALRRHLAELPDSRTGLSLTQSLTLRILAEAPRTAGEVYAALMRRHEPLPFLGDLMFLEILLRMEQVTRPVLSIDPPGRSQPWPRWPLAITDEGRAVLAGTRDFLTLRPPPRWVGGLRIDPAAPDWRWDAALLRPILRASP